MSLSYEKALELIAASHEHARGLGISVATAIVDVDGRLIAFGRMEGVHWVSIEVAQSKAYTGSLLRMEGSGLQAMDRSILAQLGIMHGKAVVPLASVTLLRDEARHVVASIGCSGGTDDEDGECARAARAAFKP